MVKNKTRIVNLSVAQGAFGSLLKTIRGASHDYDFSSLQEIRQLLNNNKAKILSIIKNNSPESIYKLAKLLGRNFKAVSKDIKLLEKYGFIELKHESKGRRKRLKPVLAIDALQLNIHMK